KHPVGVGSRTFLHREPAAQQDQRGRPDTSFCYPQKEANDEQLGNILDETGEYGKYAPGNEHDEDKLLRAPLHGQLSTGNLQQYVADEKYSTYQTCYGSADTQGQRYHSRSGKRSEEHT